MTSLARNKTVGAITLAPSNLLKVKPFRFALFYLLIGLALGGCVVAPTELQRPSADSPGIASVRANTSANLNKSVRWGGTVVGIENLENQTRLEVIARPLFRHGRPDAQRASQGRFIATFDGFLDPADYTKNREITIVGVVTGSEAGKVGQADYEFPNVQATGHKLWPGYNARFAERARYAEAGGHYGYRNHHHPGDVFSDWWIPALFWSFHGDYHRGYRHHHGSRLHLNLHYRR